MALANAKNISVDCTFDITPKPFYETMTINWDEERGTGERKVVKLFNGVLILLTCKTELCYKMAIRWLIRFIRFDLGKLNVP